jgi:hypothetical protein
MAARKTVRRQYLFLVFVLTFSLQSWNIRSANNLIVKWQRIFGFSDRNPILPILEESFEYRFNFNTASFYWQGAVDYLKRYTPATADMYKSDVTQVVSPYMNLMLNTQHSRSFLTSYVLQKEEYPSIRKVFSVVSTEHWCAGRHYLRTVLGHLANNGKLL